VADRAADDPAQHVAAAFRSRNDAVDDQESAGADVIGDDLERRAVEVAGAGDPRGGVDLAPMWNVLDMTPEERGTDWYPKLSY
jgi:predicted dithiol-disulfide oxidoreductase (DUF899 family)